MVVRVGDIEKDGLELDEAIPSSLLDTAFVDGRDTGFRSRAPSRLHAKLQKVSGGVILDANFRADVAAPCKRCVCEVRLEVPVDFRLNLVPRDLIEASAGHLDDEDDAAGGEGGSFDIVGDVNEEPFDGRTIDLDPIVREQVLLALPVSVLCREDCKGLCTVCGQNLNERECGCERKVPDPRLVSLKDIKLN